MTASDLESAALCLSMTLWVLFITGYILYGNRMRSATSRALMLMAFGWFAVIFPLFAHHILGVSTADSQWVEDGSLVFSCIGTAAITWLMLAANGWHWPWNISKEERDKNGEGWSA